jgi:signal transduction histidine kinase
VADPGIGMEPHQLQRVFERFYRADHSGAVPGTGLGMSIVNEIVSLHQGDIDIESAPRRGTRVTLWLQLAAQEVAPAA